VQKVERGGSVDSDGQVTKEPVFNVPASVGVVLAVLTGIHLIQQVLPDDTLAWFVLSLSFVPARFSAVGSQLPGGSWAGVSSWITHMFVHADITHLTFNSASLLAFGGAVAKRIGGVRFLALSLVCGLAGALAFLLMNAGLDAPMIGASGAISGLMGAATLLLCSALDQGGIRQLRDSPASVALMPLRIALRDKRILIATSVFLFLNVLAIFGIGSVETAGGIAWEAHIGGYLAGLLLFGVVDGAVRDDSNHQPIHH
jgi:membrane associated rhomboid family serine protease